MHCPECAMHGSMADSGNNGFLRSAKISVDNNRYRLLLEGTLARIPRGGHPVRLRTEVKLRRRGSLPGVVGLTTFCVSSSAPSGAWNGDSGEHTVTFYTELMNQLSDRAVVAVMAHEFAHAWLNEHLRPEASRRREMDADMLAEMWGFGEELSALAEETDPLDA